MIEHSAIVESQISELEGKQIEVGKKQFRFGTGYSVGGQAFAVPLLDVGGNEAAYFRILKPVVMSSAYLHRQQWLVGQKLHRKGRVFSAAPQLFWSSKQHGRPVGVSFDFFGTVHGLAKGISWKDWKAKCEMAKNLRELGRPFMSEPTPYERVAFAKSLILSLANLECFGRKGFVHGDLSDGNLILDQETKKITLIDFDAFIFDSPSLKKSKLTKREFGSKGTRGYIPDWHFKSKSLDDSPLGDRFARDILLIELLGFREIDPDEISPLYWDGVEEDLVRIADLANPLGLQHLTDMSVFALLEAERPSSLSLAQKLNLPVEDNTREKLDAPPVKLFQATKTAAPNDAVQSVPPAPDNAVLWLAALQSLDWRETGRLTLLVVDSWVLRVGEVALAFLKVAAVWFLGIVGVCVWVWTMILVLMKVNFPAGLILAGLIFAFPIWYYAQKQKENDQS